MIRFSCAFIIATLITAVGSANANSSQWLRYPTISPNGKQIAFSFAGDLWVVRAQGGRARQLTTHEAYDVSPVWSPDSKTIAFASNRFGNLDIYVVSAVGGEPQRLTFHSSNDLPTSFTPDGQHILFTSHRQDAPSASIGHPSMSELYEIGVEGGRPLQVLTTPAEAAVTNPANEKIAYHDYKGYEDTWRKHHRSAVARDVWLFDRKSGKHSRVTDFRGEDRNPVWSNNGKQLFWLSERNGTFNVWMMPAGKPKQAKQITKHGIHPVRFLSIANDDTICYGLNGTIWTKPLEGDPQQVSVNVVADQRTNPTRITTLTGDATEMAVSPNDDEIALVVRGEIFVTAVDYGTTKRVTDTPQQERSVVWGPDGRTLYYASERDGSWNLYKSSITREDEDRFAESTLLTEETVLRTDDETFEPRLSPDGKKLAYLNNRDEIRVLDLSTKKSSSLLPAKRNYSYSDGDVEFDWSPDSKWLAFTYNSHKRWLQDVGVVNLASGEISDVTNSGYAGGRPEWSRDGRALLFVSDRFGRRSHGSWGSDEDVFGFYLNRESWTWINRTKEEMEREKRREEKDKKKTSAKNPEEDDKDGKKEAKGKEDDDVEKKPLRIDFRYLDDRVKRLTLHSAPLAGYDLSPDGETLVFFAQVEDKWDLWKTKLRDRSTSKLVAMSSSTPGTVRFSKDGKKVFVLLGGGKLSKVALVESGNGTAKPISYQAEMNLNGPAERAHMFEHAWRQVKRKFYRQDLHGVDWQAMKDNYAAFLPSIYNNQDFAELLSEMLGELNASHTGARHRSRGKDRDATADLGLLFDVRHMGAGLKVAEVLPRGPADLDTSKIEAGVLITHIDGQRIEKGANAWPLLNKKAGKPVRLGLHHPKNGKDWEEVIKAISSGETQSLLYERWIRGRRELVDKRSKGRVGYVHIRGMNDGSFRRFYRDVLGRNSDKEALIVDTRFNGGGWLHDDLVAFLSGQDYIYFKPRGKEDGDFGAEPAFRWSRPVVVLQSESNYSDAHMFPYAFKQLKIGKLVGTPVPGTGTAVWWETLIDPSIVFGIPQVGMVTPEGKFLENLELDPDVLVYNSPESVARGEDQQLAKSVEVLLEQLTEKK